MKFNWMKPHWLAGLVLGVASGTAFAGPMTYTFDLTGESGLVPTWTLVDGPVTLELSALFDALGGDDLPDNGGPVLVSRNGSGAGVRNAFFDSNEIDGFGRNDFLIAQTTSSFALALTGASFANVDSNDGAVVRAAPTLADIVSGSSDVTSVDLDPLSASNPFVTNLEGAAFAFAAFDGAFFSTDDYRVSSLTFTNVPAPSVLALFSLGLLGLGFARRKQRS